MGYIRLAIIYLVILLITLFTAGDKIMTFSAIRDYTGPRGSQGPAGVAGPGTFTEETSIVTVTDYGATGDGVTDDTAAIQSAIDAASTGSTIMFPKGKYYISQPLTVTKRLNITGTGFYSQIYQSADENLLEIGQNFGWCRFENLYLGSAATTSGKALMLLNRVHGSYFRNIYLSGGYYGIHIKGCLRDTFVNIHTDTSNLCFGPTSINEYFIYSERSNGISSNNLNFIGCMIRGASAVGKRGYYITDTNNEGGFNIIGGIVEGHSEAGIYVSGVYQYFNIQGVHLEGGNSKIEIVSCNNGEIRQIYCSPGIEIKKSRNIAVTGGYVGSVKVDKFSKHIHISGITGDIEANGSMMDIQRVKLDSGIYTAPGGIQNRSPRNLVDGDLELWSDGLPVGFQRYGTDAIISQESDIVRFGKHSAKVETGPGEGSAALKYYVDYSKYSSDWTNYRSTAYQWTLSSNGENEYYCELSGGGDPEIHLAPHALKLNDIVVSEETMGSLGAGSWGYGDNDSLGYQTIYVRLADDGDPDSKPSGFVKGSHKLHQITASAWVYKPQINGTDPRIIAYYSNGASTSASPVFSVPVDEWARISWTFNVKTYWSNLSILFATRFNSGSGGEVCYFDGIEIVEGDSASPIYDDSRGLSGSLRIGGRLITSNIAYFPNSDSTPSVSSGNIYKTFNVNSTNITMFDNGVIGQEIKVIFGDDNTKIDFTDTNLKGNRGTNWSPREGDHMTCVFDGVNWYCDVSDNT
jgi:hypothetical protein